MPDQDTIVIRAPAGTKARWVHQSQKEGAKLSDWVVKKVEHDQRSIPSPSRAGRAQGQDGGPGPASGAG